MKKRILSALLWFYAGWYGGALLAAFLALDPRIGPIIGAAAAVLVAGDPFGVVWGRRSAAPRRATPAPDVG